MKAVIMAGGKGSRLLEVTHDEIPKPMAPVLGKPILQYQIEELKENNIKEIIIVIGHLGNKIKEYFGDGSKLDVNITYIEENEPLGTGGSLYYVSKLVTDEEFILLLGDTIFSIDINRMYQFHQEHNSKLTLFAHPNSHPFDSDLVVMDKNNKVISIDSKKNIRNYWYDNCVNGGMYIFGKNVCSSIKEPKKLDLEKEFIIPLISSGEVYAYKSPEYIKDVGTVERITSAEIDLRKNIVKCKNLKFSQKVVFLDRDGTINKSNGFIDSEDKFVLEDCAIEAIKMLNENGYLAIVISNQPSVARGQCTIDTINTINNKMKTLLGKDGAYLDDVYFCPHHPDKGFEGERVEYKIACECRKPKIGLINQCLEKYNIDLNHSWFIGDTTVDIKTGINAGVKTILVETGEAGNDAKYDLKPDYVEKNLLEAVKKVLEVSNGL